MKVIHLVLSNVFAGIEQHVDELSIFQETSCNVTVMCNDSIADKFNNKHVISFSNFNRRSPIGLLRLALKLKKLDADIIHTHGSKTTEIVNFIKKFLKLNHVCTVHGIKKNTQAYEKADIAITVSNLAKDSLKTKSVVVKNWWSPALPDNIQNGKKFILAVGRLEAVKGFDLLIKSWKDINQSLVIIGSGNDRRKLDDLIEINRLEDKISIIDEVSPDKLLDYYKNAALLVISSRKEGGPRVALEALHLKIPVISTMVGHMADILPLELLAKPDNEESLTKLIRSYVDGKTMNQDSIFRYVNEEYSLTAQGNKILKVYKDLLVS